MLWHCWLGLRKSIRPEKNDWWGVGVVICVERGADYLHMVQLMPLHPKTPSSLASFKSRLVFPFCASLPRLSWKRGRWIVNVGSSSDHVPCEYWLGLVADCRVCVCVCVCVCVWLAGWLACRWRAWSVGERAGQVDKDALRLRRTEHAELRAQHLHNELPGDGGTRDRRHCRQVTEIHDGRLVLQTLDPFTSATFICCSRHFITNVVI